MPPRPYLSVLTAPSYESLFSMQWAVDAGILRRRRFTATTPIFSLGPATTVHLWPSNALAPPPTVCTEKIPAIISQRQLTAYFDSFVWIGAVDLANLV